jgi:AcrR family transcriptional regulator
MSPRSAKEYERIRQESRQKILNAALECFTHNGYQGASMAQIARVAGVSKGLIYNYFASKEELADVLIFSSIAELMERLFMPLLELPPAEQLKELIRLSFSPDEWGVEKDYMRSFTALTTSPDLPTAVQNKLKKQSKGLVQMIVELMKKLEVDDPEGSGLLLAAQLDGIQLHWLWMQDEYPLEKMKNVLTKQCMAMVPAKHLTTLQEG